MPRSPRYRRKRGRTGSPTVVSLLSSGYYLGESMTVKPAAMTRSKEYRHYCPVARSLEVIGEKWSLLIVRDLLREPRRFTDLLHFLGGITPKWLTLRLRDLEAAGIVERDSEPGRREVWYRLTPRGRDLAPVIQELAIWGIDH